MDNSFASSKKIKVLITVPHADVAGGVANYYRIFRKYCPKRFQFFTVGNRSLKEKPWETFIRFLRDIVLYQRTIIAHSYNVIILNPSFDPKSFFRDGINLLLAKWYKRKVIVFFRGWHTKWEPIIFTKLDWLFRFCFFKADAIVTLASEFRKKMENLGYNKRIFVETTIVDDNVFLDTRLVCKHPNTIKDKQNFRLLFLSRIDKRKGVYETLNAFRILKSRYPAISLIVAGDGKEMSSVLNYIEQYHLCDVEILGYIDGNDKAESFKKANVFLFPSYYGEGMPNAVLEAMAYGLPVITRPVGGIKDFFEDGKMGYLSDNLDPKVFASLVERFIQNPNLQKNIGEYNREYARQHFASSIVIQRIEKICEKVFDEKI